jgi:short-subunit dehydrogenase
VKVIAGKRALVTGAASGIGRAIALCLARQGAGLVLLDMDAGRLEEAANEARAETSAGVTTCLVDLMVPGEIHNAVERVKAEGGIDILVNNAGLTYIAATEHMTDEMWQRLLAVNLRAPIQLTLELLPSLLARNEAHILNVCSLAGLLPHYNEIAYCLTKYAMVGFSESLRLEYRGKGLGVTALCPGFVRTNLQVMLPDGVERESVPDAMVITPERVASIALKAIKEDRGLVIGGVIPHSLWVLKRYFPAIFDWLHVKLAANIRAKERREGVAQSREGAGRL